MMPQSRALLLAAFLTWIGGFVDAVGFLSLNKIYTANMSGNSVAIGIELVSQNFVETLRRATPVAAYVVGLLFCRLLLQFSARQHVRIAATLAFLCECMLLLPVALTATPAATKELFVALFYIALLALAMGVQNAILTHFSSLTIHTGFVTGTLVKWMEQTAKYLTRLWDELGQPRGTVGRKLRISFRWKEFRLSVWLAAIWGAYVLGAVCGAFGKYQFDTRALFIPLGGLAALILMDLRDPLAIKEEESLQKT